MRCGIRSHSFVGMQKNADVASLLPEPRPQMLAGRIADQYQKAGKDRKILRLDVRCHVL